VIGKGQTGLGNFPEPDLIQYKTIPSRREKKRSGASEKNTDDPYLTWLT